MKPVQIDCSNSGWKPFLKHSLQDGHDVDLKNFDYTIDGQFCEMLAMAHSVMFNLYASHNSGSFRKRPSAVP